MCLTIKQYSKVPLHLRGSWRVIGLYKIRSRFNIYDNMMLGRIPNMFIFGVFVQLDI